MDAEARAYHARKVAERLYAEGWRQVSRKHRLVARVTDARGRTIEGAVVHAKAEPESVLDALRAVAAERSEG